MTIYLSIKMSASENNHRSNLQHSLQRGFREAWVATTEAKKNWTKGNYDVQITIANNLAPKCMVQMFESNYGSNY